jgi:hypothetical protein
MASTVRSVRPACGGKGPPDLVAETIVSGLMVFLLGALRPPVTTYGRTG